jgi:hypothetical protein
MTYKFNLHTCGDVQQTFGGTGFGLTPTAPCSNFLFLLHLSFLCLRGKMM